MTVIAELLDTETRRQVQTMCVHALRGDPPDLKTCRVWMREILQTLEELRGEIAWGLQHGNAATEGFWDWFAERYRRVLDARRRYAELKAWRDAYEGEGPVYGAGRWRGAARAG